MNLRIRPRRSESILYLFISMHMFSFRALYCTIIIRERTHLVRLNNVLECTFITLQTTVLSSSWWKLVNKRIINLRDEFPIYLTTTHSSRGYQCFAFLWIEAIHCRSTDCNQCGSSYSTETSSYWPNCWPIWRCLRGVPKDISAFYEPTNSQRRVGATKRVWISDEWLLPWGFI